MPQLFHTCGPNEAMVVSGLGLSKPLLIPGGRVFVWPMIQKIQRLSLNTITLVIESPQVYTQMGVAISVTGIAQVKIEALNKDGLYMAAQLFMEKTEVEIKHIATETLEGHQRAIMGNMTIEVRIEGSNESALRAACQMFLGKKAHEIKHIALETLEGHQRAIMGTMSIEEIYKDRKKFASAVFTVASTDLYNMGITVVSYTLKDIRDEEGYLKALGMARTAQVKRDARIGEALAKKEAGIRESKAEMERMKARFSNDIEIAKCQRDFELKNAIYDQDVNTKKAESDMAYSLQAAKTKQKIKEEQMQIKVIERTQEIQVQEQEIIRKQLELEANVKKPADAHKFQIITLANAEKKKIILQAEADSNAIKMKGEAEAFAIEAQARAEAEQMEKKALAWSDYKEAAMIEMVLKMLPRVAAEIATPLAQTNKITMVSSGKNGVGAEKITDEVMAIMNKMPGIMEGMTGIDVTKVLKQNRT